VTGILLNSPGHIRLVEEIGANALVAFNAAQRDDYAGLAGAVRQSWHLNQRLDSGTNPESVRDILAPISDCLDATKLLGAGGGGYLLMMAKDQHAAEKIRHILTANPPNPRARFVNFSVSETGLQLTRS